MPAATGWLLRFWFLELVQIAQQSEILIGQILLHGTRFEVPVSSLNKFRQPAEANSSTGLDRECCQVLIVGPSSVWRLHFPARKYGGIRLNSQRLKNGCHTHTVLAVHIFGNPSTLLSSNSNYDYAAFKSSPIHT